MFKRILIFFLVVAVIGLIALLVLPKSYEIEESIDIGAAQYSVFNVVKNLRNWIPLAMMGNLPTGNTKIPAHVQKQMDARGMGQMMSGMQGASGIMKMKFKVIAVEPPKKIQYEIEGGPLSGIKPEVLIEKVEAKLSKVTIHETYEFEGFFGGLRALAARFGSAKMHRSNLEKLKKRCEK